MNENLRKTIGSGWQNTKGFRGMLFTALVFDVFSAVPWIGIIFSGLGYATIYMWMMMRGVNSSLFSGDTKKLASTAAEFVGGAVGLGIIPGITMWTFFSIAEHTAKQAAESKKAIEETQKQQPVQQKRRTKTSVYH